jgi:hypothetical protein
MSESNAKRSNMVEKLLQKTLPRHEPEVEEAIETYQEARAQSREATMLDLRMHDGTIISFPYAYLTRVRYYPGDSMDLRFGKDEVRVSGKNLGRLRETITEQRARFIREGKEGEEALKEADEAHVDTIEIIEGEEEP